MPIDCPSACLAVVRELLARHVPEYDVWVFGSRVRGDAKPFSDIDLAVVTSQPLSTRRLALLADAFAESDLPIKVDVVDWASASDRLRDAVIAGHEVIQRATRRVGEKAVDAGDDTAS